MWVAGWLGVGVGVGVGGYCVFSEQFPSESSVL